MGRGGRGEEREEEGRVGQEEGGGVSEGGAGGWAFSRPPLPYLSFFWVLHFAPLLLELRLEASPADPPLLLR